MKKEKKSKKKGSDDDDDDDVVWYTDTSEEAARKRREEMVPDAIAKKTDEAEIAEFVNVLTNSPAIEVFDKFKALKHSQELSDDEFYHHIFAAIFNDATDLQAAAKTHATILKYVCDFEMSDILILFLVFEKRWNSSQIVEVPW